MASGAMMLPCAVFGDTLAGNKGEKMQGHAACGPVLWQPAAPVAGK